MADKISNMSETFNFSNFDMDKITEEVLKTP